MHTCILSLVWKILFLYMYIYMHVNFIYWQVPTFDFVIVVHVLVSIWHFTFLQETRPIQFEIKGAWSRFVLENFKLYQISIFNVKFFFVQFFIHIILLRYIYFYCKPKFDGSCIVINEINS